MDKTKASAKQGRPDMERPIGARPIVDADYRMMVEAVTDYAIFFIDINGAVRSWNAGARRLKGYEFAEVEGRHFSMFYPQEMVDRRWPEYELEEASRTGRFEDEGWRLRKDGSRFWANIIITRLIGPDGSIHGFSKITRDLTERRRGEELTRQSEERFRLLVENVKDYAIFLLDPSGYVISWNAGAERSKGYVASEIIGQHLSVFYPEDKQAESQSPQQLSTAMREGKFEDERWCLRKDGSRFWASVTITSVFDDTGRHRGFVMVTRDLSESRKISDLENEGRRISAYLAMLGHELRNPLAPVVSAVGLMRQIPIESPPLRAARDVIDRQVQQMARMIDDLLDVSRITSGSIRLERKPVALADVVDQAVETSQPLMDERGHVLSVKLDAAPLWVSGDRARLVQVVTNLLNNAAKYTPPGGQVAIDVVPVGRELEIRVRDNGSGIEEGLQEHIFELFVQGKQDISRGAGGLGVGLALSRQIVHQHGGSIAVFSKGVPGAGSEFVVKLPAVAAPAGWRRPDTQGRKRVLVVDDNQDSANMMVLLVESLGFETLVAYDGPAAIESVLAQSPDLVLLDIGLPGLSGLDVAMRIGAEILNPPKLVAISGYGQESDREASLKAGFQAHLVKPVPFEQLSLMLKNMLG